MIEGNLTEGTRKLYYEDAYQAEFTARVLSCEASGENYKVVLDQTAFFPEEGGQSPDFGVLYGADGQKAQVSYTEIGNGIISHVTDRPFAEGEAVRGVIDFAHRFSHMQQHTAEHICSGLVHSMYGFENAGFHLSDSEVTMDYTGVLSKEMLDRVEDLVNEAIWKNIPVTVLFPDKEEEAKLNYRSKLEIEGQVRVVSVDGYDMCACCAPHVLRTGEIGIFKIVSGKNYKGGTRVRMLAGKRALEFLKKEHDILTGIAEGLSTSAENVPQIIKKMKEEVQEKGHQLMTARKEMLFKTAREVPEGQEKAVLFTEITDMAALRDAVNALMEKGITAGIFGGTDAEGYRFVIGGPEADSCMKALRDALNAKGGGKPPMMQGSVAACREEIRRIFEPV